MTYPSTCRNEIILGFLCQREGGAINLSTQSICLNHHISNYVSDNHTYCQEIVLNASMNKPRIFPTSSLCGINKHREFLRMTYFPLGVQEFVSLHEELTWNFRLIAFTCIFFFLFPSTCHFGYKWANMASFLC